MSNSESNKRPPGWTKTAQKRKRKPEYARVESPEVKSIESSERAQEAKLQRKGEEKFGNFLDHLGDIAYEADTSGNVTYVNKMAEKITGFPLKDIIRKPFLPLFTKESQQKVVDVYERTLNGEGTEYELTFTNGKICHFKNEPLRDEDGKITGVFGIARDITERKRVERELQESQKQFKNLFNNALLGLYKTTPDGRILMANPALLRMLGYDSFEELAKRNLEEVGFEPQYSRSDFKKRIETDGRVVGLEADWVRRDGTILSVRESAKAIRDELGNVLYYEGTIEDITERKRAEQELRRHRDHLEEIVAIRTRELEKNNEALRIAELRFRSLIEQTTDAVFCYEYDPPILTDLPLEQQLRLLNDGVLVECNEIFAKSYGSDRAEDVIGKRLKELFRTTPRSLDKLFTVMIEGGYRIVDTEVTEKHKDRTEMYYLYNGHGVIEDGKLIRVWGTFRDITDRKKAQETLRQYEFMVESAHDAIFFKDRQGRYIIANKKTLESFGLPREKVVGKNDYEIMPDKEQAKNNIDDDRAVFKTGKPKEIIKEMTGADGKKYWFQAVKVPHFDENGDVVGLIGIARDITEHKQAEEELKIREQKLRALLNAPTESAILVDVDGVILDINRIAAQRLGRSAEQLIGMGIYDYLPAEIAEYRKARGEEVISSGEPMRFQDEREGHYYDNNIFPVFDDKGKVNAVAVFSHDITERKQAEEALQDSEKKLRRAQEVAHIGSWYQYIKTNRLVWSDEVYRIFGVPVGKPLQEADFLALVHPDDEPYVRRSWAAALQGEQYDIEHRIVTADTVKWVREKAEFEFDADGKPVLGIGTVQDITDRKQAEEALKESESRFRELVENMREVFWMENADGTELLYVSPTYEKVWGRSCQSFYDNPQQWIESIHPEDKQRIIEAFSRLRKTGEYSEEFRIVRQDGTIRWIWDRGVLIRNESDEIVHAAGVAEDITERKQAEEALKESEEKFRSLAEQSPNMIFINKAGKIVYVNKKCEEVMGYERDELCSEDFEFRTLVAPESLKLIEDNFAKHLRGEDVEPCDYTIISKDGKRIEAIYTSKLIQYEGGTSILGIVTDITERKIAEQALRESEERLKILFESAPDAIYLADSEGRFVDGNRAAEELIGYKREDVIGKKVADVDILSAEQLPRAQANLQKVIAGDLSGPIEYTVKRKDGTYVSIEVRNFPVKIGGKILSLGIARDITEHKRTEQELLEHQAKLKSLASQLSLTEERERHRLATDLHDQISQSLVISKIKLDQLHKSSASDELNESLKDISDCLGQIIDDTRALTFDLSYPILYELGFEAAVSEWLTDQIQEKHQIETEFEDDRQQKPLDDDIRVLLFRNVRELLINVIKHAEANKVRVSIYKDKEYINIRVEDDGVGFDPVEVTSMAAKRAEFGLFSIRERLEQLGGQIEINSGRGRGSKITMRAPLKINNSADRISR